MTKIRQTSNSIYANWTLLPQGVVANVRIEIADDGTIFSVETGVRAETGDVKADLLLPGMPNLHSHAFQFAMAGLAEHRSSNAAHDSFWTWREVMYRFAGQLSPEQVRVIAEYLYIRMVKAGYMSVGEFHYLHHQPDGSAYSDPTEMSGAVRQAAENAGIGQCLLPVLYQRGGFDGAPLSERQRRFGHETEAYLRLLEKVQAEGDMGVCCHSLRAVPKEAMQEVLAAMPRMELADAPVHIHIAEQQQEVDDCLAWGGARPVAWLLDAMPVDEHWCLVHATHLDELEVEGLAASGAVAGLCPTTEANLGDGLFPMQPYMQHGGVWGIGSDSHITVNPFEELRLLEYGQRLKHQQRLVMADDEQRSVGAYLWQQAAKGGAQALGLHGGVIAEGARADMVGVMLDDPLYEGRKGDVLLDTLIFASQHVAVSDVFVAGEHVVSDGVHAKEEGAARAFRQVMRELLD